MNNTHELVSLLQNNEMTEEEKDEESSSHSEEIFYVETSVPAHAARRGARYLAFLRAIYSQFKTRKFEFGTLPAIALFIMRWVLTARPRYMIKNGLQPRRKQHRTSYLDSLRGWAALIVFNCHFHPVLDLKFWHHPFVHIGIQGAAMVNVFFVISGYVLTYRILRLMRTRDAGQLLHAFVSSIFRRYVRLFGSSAFVTFMIMLVVHFNWYLPELRKESMLAQLQDWAWHFGMFSNVFTPILKGYYDYATRTMPYLDLLWTIPVEYRGSIIVYVYNIGVSKISSRNRMALTSLLMIACFYYQAIYVALFLGGSLLADLSFIHYPDDRPPLSGLHLTSQPLHQKIFYSMLLILSTYLLSQPGDPRNGWWPWPDLINCIIRVWPEGDMVEVMMFLPSIGALLLVCALDAYPTLQRPLNTKFSRYLGDLSFGIYVMHWPLMKLVYLDILNPPRLKYFGEGTLALSVCILLMYAAVLWAADLFIRMDDKVIALAKWLEERLFVW